MEKKIELQKCTKVSDDQIVKLVSSFINDDNSVMIVSDGLLLTNVNNIIRSSTSDKAKSKLNNILISGTESYADFIDGRKNIYVITTARKSVIVLVNYALMYDLNLFGIYGVKIVESKNPLDTGIEVILGLPHSGKTKKLMERFIETTEKEKDKDVLFYTCEDTVESIIERVGGIDSNFEDTYLETILKFKIGQFHNFDKLKSYLVRFHLIRKDCILFLDSPNSIHQPCGKTLSEFLEDMKEELERYTSHNLRIIYTETLPFTVERGKLNNGTR